MKTKHAAFSLYRKRIGGKEFWYARYWDERTRRYAAHRATGIEVCGKKERRSDAERAAAELLKTISFGSPSGGLLPYLKDFWRKDSAYFREHAFLHGRPVSHYYIKQANDTIRLLIGRYEPFARLTLGELTPAVIRDFLVWAHDEGFPRSRIHKAVRTMRVPLRYLMEREELERDPFARVQVPRMQWREKGVLTPHEVGALLAAPVRDARRRGAVLLAVLCGLRRGEARGLLWEDIDGDILHIRHNWQDVDGLKEPKYGSFRDVPLPQAVKDVLGLLERKGPYVFSGRKEGEPASIGFFIYAFERELEAIGLGPDVRKERNITYHSFRHTFVSLMRLAGLNDFQVQALAGHKSLQMMQHYSHAKQVMDVGVCRDAVDRLVSGELG